MCETAKELSIKMKSKDELYQNNFKNMGKDISDIKKSIKGIENTLNNFILKVETEYITEDKAKKKFASKLTEKMVYSTAGMMLSALIMAIVYLVINK